MLQMESQLSAAPQYLEILGQLHIKAVENRDFSLVSAEWDVKKFQYFRHPQSYRACLSHTSFHINKAFLQADTAMNAVNMAMEQVPRYLTSMLRTVRSDQSSQIKLRVAANMKQIMKIAIKSIEEVKAVAEAFDMSCKCMQQLTESVLATHADAESQKEKLLKTRQELKQKKQKLDAEILKMEEEKRKRANSLGQSVAETATDSHSVSSFNSKMASTFMGFGRKKKKNDGRGRDSREPKDRVQQVEAELDKMARAEERYERYKDNRKECKKREAEIRVQLQDYERVAAVKAEAALHLKDGLSVVTELKSGWTSLLVLFAKMTNMVGGSLSQKMDGIVEQLGKGKRNFNLNVHSSLDFSFSVQAHSLSQSDYECLAESLFDSILEECLEAAHISYVVERMAKTYEEISDGHLLPMLKPFQHILNYDVAAKEDREEIAESGKKIRRMRATADEAIRKAVKKNAGMCQEWAKKRQTQL